MALFDQEILDKLSEVTIPELMDSLIEHQEQQDKNFNSAIKLLTEAVNKIAVLNSEISKEKGEPLNGEISKLTDQVRQSLSLISSKQSFNDTNIMQGLVSIANQIKKISTSDISKGIETLAKEVSKKNDRMECTVQRDTDGLLYKLIIETK